MDSAARDSNNLMLRIIGGPEDQRLLSVNTQQSLLSDRQPSDPANCVECFLERSGEGVFIQCRNGAIDVNGETCQSDWLVKGDQIQVGATRYEVQQLGMCLVEGADVNLVNPAVEDQRESVNQVNAEFRTASQADSQQSSPVTSQFEKLEQELDRQTRSIADINQRLDQFATQLSALSESISNGAGKANGSWFDSNDVDPASASEAESGESCRLDPLDDTQTTIDQAAPGSVDVFQTATATDAEVKAVAGSDPACDQSSAIPKGFGEAFQEAWKEKCDVSATAHVEAEDGDSEQADALPVTVGDKVADAASITDDLSTSLKQVFDDKKSNPENEPVNPEPEGFRTENGACDRVPENESRSAEDLPVDPSDNHGYAESDDDHAVRINGILEHLLPATPDNVADPASDGSANHDPDGANSDGGETESGILSEALATGDDRVACSAIGRILSQLDSADHSNPADEGDESMQPTKPQSTSPELSDNTWQNGNESALSESGRNGEAESGHQETTDQPLVAWQEREQRSDLAAAASDACTPLSSAGNQQCSTAVIVGKNAVAGATGETSCEIFCEQPDSFMDRDDDVSSGRLETDHTGQKVKAAGRPEFQNESVADVLSRMNRQVDLPDDTSQAADDGSDDSANVQDYMNSLLQRLNGNAVAPPMAGTGRESANGVGSPVKKPLQPAVDGEQRLKPDEFKPKRVAPEIKTNLEAMRELANANTRSAVKSSESKRRKSQSQIYLVFAGGSVTGSVLSFNVSQRIGDPSFLLGIGLLVLAILFAALFAKSNISGDPQQGSRNDEGAPSKFPLDLKWFSEIRKGLLSNWNRNPEADS